MKELLCSLGSWIYIVLTNKLVVLALGGAVGTNARYWLGRWIGETFGAKGFPLGTFVINVTGSFLLGVAAVVILERMPPEYQGWYLLIGTGFCGGFTTFSTFEWETYQLIRNGSMWTALANVAGSVGAGFLGVVLAVALGGLLLSKQ